jgi:hypothetical protein
MDWNILHIIQLTMNVEDDGRRAGVVIDIVGRTEEGSGQARQALIALINELSLNQPESLDLV